MARRHFGVQVQNDSTDTDRTFEVRPARTARQAWRRMKSEMRQNMVVREDPRPLIRVKERRTNSRDHGDAE